MISYDESLKRFMGRLNILTKYLWMLQMIEMNQIAYLKKQTCENVCTYTHMHAHAHIQTHTERGEKKEERRGKNYWLSFTL